MRWSIHHHGTERFAVVQAIARDGKRWRLKIPDGDVTADHVVLACSFWARELAEPLGLNLPIYPPQNHIINTESVPELEALDFYIPTVRDPCAPSVTR